MMEAAVDPGRAAFVQLSTRTVAVFVLIAMGYLGASHPWLIAAAAGCVALAIWAAVAFRLPQAATAASFALLLVAGTKFRSREATDSLAGIVDLQIALELAIYAFVGTAVIAAAAGRFRHDRWRPSAVEALILGYAGFALMSIAWSQAPALTLVRASQLLVISGLAIFAVRILQPSRAMWTVCSTLAAYVLACAASTAIFAAEMNVDPDGGAYRFAWFAVHPIVVGTLAAIAALAMLSASLFSRAGAHRVFGLPRLLVLTLLLAILIVTSARGPALAFIAAAATLMFMRTSWAARLTLLTLASVATLAYVASGSDIRDWLAAASTSDSFVTQAFFRGQSIDTLLSLNGRLELWDELSPVLALRPIGGPGFQASRAVVLDTAPWAAYAHNALLQTMLDLGIAGAVMVIGLVGAGFAGVFRRGINVWLRALIAALMVFLTLNSVSTESFAGSPGFETLLLFICASCAAPRRPGQTESDR